MSTDPKRRGVKRKMKKPPENRYVKAKQLSENREASVAVLDRDDQDEESDDEETCQQKTATPTSRSEMKLSQMYKILDESDIENDSDASMPSEIEEPDTDVQLKGYRIIDIGLLAQNISSKLKCGLCSSDVSLIEVKREGLASELAFHCSNRRCGGSESFPTCEKIQTATNLTTNSINRRTTFAMRCIGCDHSDLQTFCGVMNLPPPATKTTHKRHMKSIEKVAKEVMEDSMKNAGKQEHELADEIENLSGAHYSG